MIWRVIDLIIEKYDEDWICSLYTMYNDQRHILLAQEAAAFQA